MGLNDIDRNNLVAFRLTKAKETLAEVPVQLANKFYRTAANRLYYACYYATTALLLKDGHETHTHSGVKVLLGLHYLNSNTIDKSFGKMYRHLFNLRQTGDYEDWINIEESDIVPFLEPASKFIETIENMIYTTK